MPKFELIPLAEAKLSSATGKRAEVIREYVGYIEQLQEGQAGKLQITEGEETGAAVRRRLGAAAKLAGTDLVIKRAGEEVYFWVRSGLPGRPRRKRGRPRKSQPSQS